MDGSLRLRAEQLANEFAGQATTARKRSCSGLMRLMMKSAAGRMLNGVGCPLGPQSSRQFRRGRAGLRKKHCYRANGIAGDPSHKRAPNRRNGRSPKTIQGDLGELTLATPRDRNGTFEPQLIGKHQRRLPGFDEKILALYAKGMTTRDIQDIVQELYGVEVSAMLVSEITADLDAEVTA